VTELLLSGGLATSHDSRFVQQQHRWTRGKLERHLSTIFSTIAIISQKTFGTLTHIVQLDLSKNQIKFLPDDFGKLTNLRHLDLYNNKIEHLPLSFGNLKKLRYLDLKGNPLKPALLPVVGKCLTNKDCTDAARKTVGFMAELEVQVRQEQLKEEEKKRMHEQAEADKAKKEEAARKKTVKKEKAQKTKKQALQEEKPHKKTKSADDEKPTAKFTIDPTKNAMNDDSAKSGWRLLYLLFLAFIIFYLVVYNATAYEFLSQYLKPEDVEEIGHRRVMIQKYLESHFEKLLSQLPFSSKQK
jgi:Leucine rich repeat